ncbi:MAG: SRPBCC domain-containing protein, partial [Streptosporangiaceae bacterium]
MGVSFIDAQQGAELAGQVTQRLVPARGSPGRPAPCARGPGVVGRSPPAIPTPPSSPLTPPKVPRPAGTRPQVGRHRRRRHRPAPRPRVFDASRELVYRAFTDPGQLAQWFGPSGCSVPRDSIEIDARPGGHLRFVMTAP